MPKQIVVTGLQPTGKLHLGNYLGAIRNMLKLQNEYECFFMIADYHSLTEDYDPKEKQRQVIELAAELIAAGINSKRSTLFVQSAIPEHLELAWIFNTLTPISYLERMTQYKDKAGRQSANINVGLFDYPVLQAADILIYHAAAVPVGQDQDQHLELTREIVRLFNNRFGQTFTEPKTLHTDTPRVMSLLEPTKKMSKSLGPNHCLFLDDAPEVLTKKLGKAVTDMGDGTGSGALNLLTLSRQFSSDTTYNQFAAAQKAGTLRYSDLKETLARDLATAFTEFRQKKSKLTDKKVNSILKAGARRAQRVAIKTMQDVRKKVGIR